MAQRAIREYHAKRILKQVWTHYFDESFQLNLNTALTTSGADLTAQAHDQSWLNHTGLVVKPDQVFGKRGKNGLVYLKNQNIGDITLADAAQWIDTKTTTTTTLSNGISGQLTHFIVEPFTPHEQHQEYYISMTQDETDDIIYLSAFGGIDIEENWDTVSTIRIPVDTTDTDILARISEGMPKDIRNANQFAQFASCLYRLFKETFFTYLEINPVVFSNNQVYLLDMVAKVDDTAGFLMTNIWHELDFPTPFGQAELTPEEKRIKELDENSGSSLKLTILNPAGIIWTLVAGGGASVVYADTIANYWSVNELANYGEYSGNPSTDETYQYARTVIDLMTREKDAQSREKILLIGGAIANFTDVAKTFKGIIKAIEELSEQMRTVGVKIYVRRAGPNYELGLKNIKAAAEKCGIPIQVYDATLHMTDIVKIALDDTQKEAIR